MTRDDIEGRYLQKLPLAVVCALCKEDLARAGSIHKPNHDLHRGDCIVKFALDRLEYVNDEPTMVDVYRVCRDAAHEWTQKGDAQAVATVAALVARLTDIDPAFKRSLCEGDKG